MEYSEEMTSGTGYTLPYLDCSGSGPFGGGPVCPDAADPLIAVGGPAGQRIVHVVYDANSMRFATKAGTQWTLEDLSVPSYRTSPASLATDPKGAAWISAGGGLYRHRSAGTWDPVPVPCGVTVTSVAADYSGAVYVGTGKNEIWRRDATGAWGAEATPGIADRVYTGDGTVHYTGMSADSYSNLLYGRRVGTTWSGQSLGATYGYYDGLDMALDACGAPHFVYCTEDVSGITYSFPIEYLRWTAVGWRSSTIYTATDIPGPSLGVAPNYAEFTFLTAGGYPVDTVRLPLR